MNSRHEKPKNGKSSKQRSLVPRVWGRTVGLWRRSVNWLYRRSAQLGRWVKKHQSEIWVGVIVWATTQGLNQLSCVPSRDRATREELGQRPPALTSQPDSLSLANGTPMAPTYDADKAHRRATSSLKRPTDEAWVMLEDARGAFWREMKMTYPDSEVYRIRAYGIQAKITLRLNSSEPAVLLGSTAFVWGRTGLLGRADLEMTDSDATISAGGMRRLTLAGRFAQYDSATFAGKLVVTKSNRTTAVPAESVVVDVWGRSAVGGKLWRAHGSRATGPLDWIEL